MKQFSLKQIEEIADKSGNTMHVVSNGKVQIVLPEINGLEFVDRTARVIVWFKCSEWDKDPYKRKFIIACINNTLQRCQGKIYWTGRTARALINDIRAEKDPVKFCKHMLQKTINKAKLLKKNEIKKAGARYELV